MNDVFEIYFSGSATGLMRYLDYLANVCEFCQGTGIVTKTEWVGTDDSYEVSTLCSCMKD